MPTLSELKNAGMPRFRVPGKDKVYSLFDAFIKTTLENDQVIDFSKEPISNPDGSFEFFTTEGSFKDMLLKVKKDLDASINIKTFFKQENNNAYFNVIKEHLSKLFLLGVGDIESTLHTKAEGLWSMGMVVEHQPANFCFLIKLLHQIVTWPQSTKPATIKLALEKKCLTVDDKDSGKASVRHAILHFCNQDKYIHLINQDDKTEFVKRWGSLPAHKADCRYMVNGELIKCYENGDYVAHALDERLCEIFDNLREKNLNMDYYDFMRANVYGSKK